LKLNPAAQHSTENNRGANLNKLANPRRATPATSGLRANYAYNTTGQPAITLQPGCDSTTTSTSHHLKSASRSTTRYIRTGIFTTATTARTWAGVLRMSHQRRCPKYGTVNAQTTCRELPDQHYPPSRYIRYRTTWAPGKSSRRVFDHQTNLRALYESISAITGLQPDLTVPTGALPQPPTRIAAAQQCLPGRHTPVRLAHHSGST